MATSSSPEQTAPVHDQLSNEHAHGGGDDDGHNENGALLPFDQEGGRVASEVGTYKGPRWRRRGILRGLVNIASLLVPGGRRRTTLSDGPEQIPGSEYPALRRAFNYPEPGMKLRKTAWLDALRGIAAFEVFIFHYTDQWIEKIEGWGPAPDNKPDAWWTAPFLRSFYAAGSAAVCLFFAISGYVLTVRILGLIRRRQTEEVLNSLCSAIMRRAIRLYLPIYITTFILLNLEWMGFPKPMHYEHKSTYSAELGQWWYYVVGGWMPIRFPDRFKELLNQYDGTISWTIPIEYYGSIVTYLCLLFTCRITTLRLRLPIFVLFMIMSAIKDEWYVVQFLFGALYAEYQLVEAEQPTNVSLLPRWRVKLHKAFAIFLLVFGFYLWGLPEMRFAGGEEPGRPIVSRPGFDWLFPIAKYFQWYDSRQVDRYYQSIAANCLLVGAGELASAQRFLERPSMQYLGRISFGLYLSHIWVREALRPLDNVYLSFMGLDTSIELNQQPMSLAYCIAFSARLVLAAIVNFLVAGFFERTIDQSSVSLAKRFEQSILSLNDKWSGYDGGVGRNGRPVELAERTHLT